MTATKNIQRIGRNNQSGLVNIRTVQHLASFCHIFGILSWKKKLANIDGFAQYISKNFDPSIYWRQYFWDRQYCLHTINKASIIIDVNNYWRKYWACVGRFKDTDSDRQKRRHEQRMKTKIDITSRWDRIGR